MLCVVPLKQMIVSAVATVGQWRRRRRSRSIRSGGGGGSQVDSLFPSRDQKYAAVTSRAANSPQFAMGLLKMKSTKETLRLIATADVLPLKMPLASSEPIALLNIEAAAVIAAWF